ncbi:hypothetical protein FXE96_10090 [Vibrio cholerae]|uniref:hypothetical protein n=1 Tax=Vibrio cholerae TaxID=666 RepID=UPI0011DBE5C1|nr:hypothetical protein [Vibrio cholerae]TXX76150.1 hypothetical protein FXE96_10090 [Vibrio cholerae]GIA27231.1 hypothetical protein VCSRO130_1409 [Vibrio cholerae]
MSGLKRLFDHIAEMVNNDQIPKVRDPESGVIYGYFDQAFGLAMNAKKEVEAELELNKAKLAAVTKERDLLHQTLIGVNNELIGINSATNDSDTAHEVMQLSEKIDMALIKLERK